MLSHSSLRDEWGTRPAAILLWALCAIAGWILLGDQIQQTLALLLVPAWIVCEWGYRADPYNGSDVLLTRIIAVIAATYLTCFLHSRRRVVFGILFAVGAIALCICIPILSEGWEWMGYQHNWGFVPLSLRLGAYLVLLFTFVFVFFTDRRGALPVAVIAAMSFALPWMHTTITEGRGHSVWRHSEPSVFLYAMVAAVAVFLAWWGVQQASKAMVNYAVVAFALTVVWFYFSSIMGKLDRSLGLIVLGILFLAGGWVLEKTRRRLVAHIAEVKA